MNETYHFHICCQAEKFSGQGRTCYAAAVNAIGKERAELFAQNTTQGHYRVKGEIVGYNKSGVSNFKSKNGLTIASVTRLVNGKH